MRQGDAIFAELHVKTEKRARPPAKDVPKPPNVQAWGCIYGRVDLHVAYHTRPRARHSINRHFTSYTLEYPNVTARAGHTLKTSFLGELVMRARGVYHACEKSLR